MEATPLLSAPPRRCTGALVVLAVCVALSAGHLWHPVHPVSKSVVGRPSLAPSSSKSVVGRPSLAPWTVALWNASNATPSCEAELNRGTPGRFPDAPRPQTEACLDMTREHTRCCRVPQVLVGSAGGTGTNTVWGWLQRAGVLVGTRDGTWGEFLCHAMAPVVDDARYVLGASARERADAAAVRRAVFVYDEPCAQVNSLLQRPGYMDKTFAKRLHMNMSKYYSADRVPLPAVLRALSRTLFEYVDRDVDELRLEEQFVTWTRPDSARPFPVLALKFSAVWAHVAQLARFAGVTPLVNASARDADFDFPAPHARHHRHHETEALLARCRNSSSLAALRRHIGMMPDLAIMWQNRSFASVNQLVSFLGQNVHKKKKRSRK